MQEALVFDYDGVIADTEPLHWRSWQAVLSLHGIKLGWEDYCLIGRGVSDAAIFEHFREQIHNSAPSLLAVQNSRRKQMVQSWSLAESPISPETIALLRSLASHRVGLVTSSDRSEVEPVLLAAQISDCFHAKVFGDESLAPKPSPAPYLAIAERLGVKTGIAFEDSEPGLASAAAAGFRAVRVPQPHDLPQIVARSLR